MSARQRPGLGPGSWRCGGLAMIDYAEKMDATRMIEMFL